MRTRVTVILLVTFAGLGAGDWPQWRGPHRDGVWPDPRLPEAFPDRLPARWRRPIGGGYGGVAVSGGRVYLLDRQTQPREVERVVCLDSATGKTQWAHEYPVAYGKLGYGNGPRATPTVHAGRVYTYGALGHLHCLDAVTGKVLWRRDTVRDFKGRVPTWGHACSPLIDGDRLVVQVGGQPESCLVALDAATGKEIWHSLPDRPGYCSVVLVPTGRGLLLAYWTPEHVVGLEPETGKVRWKVPFEGISYDVAISDVVFADGVLLASNYWSGSKAVRLNEDGDRPEVAWQGKQLSLLMSTPLVRGGHVYALDRHRGLMCLEMRTGKVLWQDEHVTPRGTNPQASLVWAGRSATALILNERGELVVAELKPQGCRTMAWVPILGRTWAHPAYAEGCIFARNDEEIVCVPLVGK
jgi:outer membrane protein assembly factor BamB